MNLLFTGLGRALTSHLKALTFLFREGLWWYLLFPLLLNILIFVLGISIVSDFSDQSLTELNSWLSNLDIGIDPESWVYAVLYFVIWLVFRLFYFLVFAFLGGYLVLMLLSPILAILSQSVENKLTGKTKSFKFSEFLNEMLRGIAISVRNFVLEIFILILFFVLSFVPFLGILSPVILFFVTAFYYGFSIMDYNMERRGLGINQSIQFMRKHRGSVVGIGAPFALVLLIPFIGSFFIGFVAIITTISGTLETLRIEKDS